MKRLPAVSALLVFAITWLLYRDATLNHFYEMGAGSDPMWFSGMLWHGDLWLTSPRGMGPDTYYNAHLTPLLVLPALASHFFEFDSVGWYAVVIGAFHAFTTAGLTWLVSRSARATWSRPIWAELLAGAIGIAFALSGAQAQYLTLPHHEIIIPGLLTALLSACALRSYRWAGFWLASVILAREDGGLHAFLILGVVVLLIRWRERRWLKNEAVLAIVALAGGLAAFALMRVIAPRPVGYFFSTYIGDPAFAQLHDLGPRAWYFICQNGHVWAPLALMALASALQRDLLLAAGPLAIMPWLLTQVFLGLPHGTWTLAFHYAFPLLFAVSWPTLHALYRRAQPCAPSPRGDRWRGHWWVLQLLTVVCLYMPTLSTTIPDSGSRYRFMQFSLTTATGGADAVQSFRRVLAAGRGELGRVAASLGVIGLAPEMFDRSEWLELLPASSAKPAPANLDTILLWDGRYICPEANALIAATGWSHVFELIGTRVVVISRRPLEDLPSFAPFLVRRSPRPQYCRRPSVEAFATSP